MVLLALAGCGTAEEEMPAVAPAGVSGPALILSAPRSVVLRPVQAAGQRRLWRGEEGVAVATDGPRVTATAGFGQMVMGTRFDGADPLEDARALLAAPAVARRLVDLSGAERDPATMRFGLALDCTLRARAMEEETLVEERCVGGGIVFTNRFWIEPASGRVRRSEQWAGDGLSMLEMRHLDSLTLR